MLVDNDQNTESSWHFPPPLSKWLFLPPMLFLPLVLFHFLAFLHPAAAVDISSLDRLADVNLQKESNILKISWKESNILKISWKECNILKIS